ncbi:hypothetical protein KKH13_00445 [Patescibacteria group bacterium]|nr:hypothetical protein [Patescibacteria group bacterium]
MPNAEFIQSATQFSHQAKEVINFASQANLLQTLTDLGHPYALLLGQSNASSIVEELFPPKKGEGKALKNKELLFDSSVIPCSWPSLKSALISNLPWWGSEFLYGTSLNVGVIASIMFGSLNSERKGKSTSIPENIRENLSNLSDSSSMNENDPSSNMPTSALVNTSLSKGSILSSAKHNPDSARKINMEQLFTQQTFLAPLFLKALAGEKESSERTRDLEISRGSVGLGTTCIKLTTYQGKQPFVIKTPQGEPIAEINPGDQLGHLHVSHQAAFMRDLTPLEKSQKIIEDFIDLFRFVDQAEVLGLDQKQQETIDRARSATLIGISHLVRLFRHRTGLPTWKLDVLPELVQQFHQHDSQAVSSAFGGTRKVKSSDMEMMIVTPGMRQQLVTSYA